jgi:hypothetical protein
VRARSPLVLLALVAAVTGCLGATQPLGPAVAPLPPALDPALALVEGRGFALRVPVDVVVLGFDPGTAAALQVVLDEDPVLQDALVQPTAVFRVHEASAALTAGALAAIEAARVPDAPGDLYDANAVEDWLAVRLPAEGVPMDPDTPALVLLHGGDTLPQGHGYRVTYPKGWLEPVRLFGERHPLLVLDASAAEDKYVTEPPFSAERLVFGSVFGASQPDAYDFPLEPRGQATVEALAEAARDAVQYRLLQGDAVPVSTKPCHAVTLLLGVRATALTETLPGHAAAEASVDLLDSVWENVTDASNVEVDLRVLRLPLDDPVLDVVSRGGLGTSEAIKAWVSQNWASYWVPHEGCEAYVTFLVFGDPADADSFGIAMHDVQADHRVAFIVVNDATRLRDAWRGPAQEVVGTGSPSRVPDWVTYLYAHETGHLLGQAHPHNIALEDGTLGTDRSFSSVWSAMSYQTDDRVSDFGALDRANHLRNRAGSLVKAAVDAGLQDTSGFADAMALLRAYRWQAAGDALVPLLQQG